MALPASTPSPSSPSDEAQATLTTLHHDALARHLALLHPRLAIRHARDFDVLLEQSGAPVSSTTSKLDQQPQQQQIQAASPWPFSTTVQPRLPRRIHPTTPTSTSSSPSSSSSSRLPTHYRLHNPRCPRCALPLLPGLTAHLHRHQDHPPSRRSPRPLAHDRRRTALVLRGWRCSQCGFVSIAGDAACESEAYPTRTGTAGRDGARASFPSLRSRRMQQQQQKQQQQLGISAPSRNTLRAPSPLQSGKSSSGYQEPAEGRADAVSAPTFEAAGWGEPSAPAPHAPGERRPPSLAGHARPQTSRSSATADSVGHVPLPTAPATIEKDGATEQDALPSSSSSSTAAAAANPPLARATTTTLDERLSSLRRAKKGANPPAECGSSAAAAAAAVAATSTSSSQRRPPPSLAPTQNRTLPPASTVLGAGVSVVAPATDAEPSPTPLGLGAWRPDAAAPADAARAQPGVAKLVLGGSTGAAPTPARSGARAAASRLASAPSTSSSSFSSAPHSKRKGAGGAAMPFGSYGDARRGGRHGGGGDGGGLGGRGERSGRGGDAGKGGVGARGGGGGGRGGSASGTGGRGRGRGGGGSLAAFLGSL